MKVNKILTFTIMTIVALTIVAGALTLFVPKFDISQSLYPTIFSVVIFYTSLNALSFNLHNIIAKYDASFMTRFYLLDKAVRFLSSIIMIGILIYLSRNVGVAVVALTCYIVAMVLEIYYFVTVDKKKELKNA